VAAQRIYEFRNAARLPGMALRGIVEVLQLAGDEFVGEAEVLAIVVGCRRGPQAERAEENAAQPNLVPVRHPVAGAIRFPQLWIEVLAASAVADGLEPGEVVYAAG